MRESKLRGVQEHAAQAFAFKCFVAGEIAVFAVAREREAEVREMDANLVRAPGFQFDFEQAEIPPASDQMHDAVRGLAVRRDTDAALALGCNNKRED